MGEAVWLNRRPLLRSEAAERVARKLDRLRAHTLTRGSGRAGDASLRRPGPGEAVAACAE